MQKMEPKLKICKDHMGILLSKLEMWCYVLLFPQLVSFWGFKMLLSMHHQGILESYHRPASKKHKSTGGKFPEVCSSSNGTNVIINIEPHTVSRLVVF